MKQISAALSFFLIIFFSTQTFSKEFEGIVTYEIKIIPYNKSIKVKKLKKAFGKEHVFYYKNGAHKWLSSRSPFHYEIYNPNVDADHVYSKYRDEDSLVRSKGYDSKDTVEKGVDVGQQVIANKICYGHTFHIENEKGRVFSKRTWYCSNSGLEFNPDRYSRYKSNGQHFLVQHCGSVP